MQLLRDAASAVSHILVTAFLAACLLLQAERTVAEERLQRFEARLAAGRLAEGPEVLRSRRGEKVELAIVSDSAGELHLHGYDLTVLLVAGERARLEFLADFTGRFPLEMHGGGAGRHRPILYLEVYPE